jgi:hypothetical protein
MNEDRTGSKPDLKLTQPRSGTVRYELINKDGKRQGLFYTAFDAAQQAKRWWPDQEQDEDRTGKGWDVQVVGCDR